MIAQDAHTLFTALYEQHYHRIYQRASFLLGSHEEAEDAVQKTFLSAWQHRDDLTCEAAALGWLYTTVSRKCIDVLRRRNLIAYSPLDTCSELVASTPDVADAATSIFDKALKPLSADERTVCLLVADKYKMREIAAMMGKSLTAIKMISNRGKQKLRQRYAEMQEETVA